MFQENISTESDDTDNDSSDNVDKSKDLSKRRFKKKNNFLTKIKQKFQTKKDGVKINENTVDILSKEDKLKKIESFISTKSVELESLDPKIHNLNIFHKQHKKRIRRCLVAV